MGASPLGAARSFRATDGRCRAPLAAPVAAAGPQPRAGTRARCTRQPPHYHTRARAAGPQARQGRTASKAPVVRAQLFGTAPGMESGLVPHRRVSVTAVVCPSSSTTLGVAEPADGRHSHLDYVPIGSSSTLSPASYLPLVLRRAPSALPVLGRRHPCEVSLLYLFADPFRYGVSGLCVRGLPGVLLRSARGKPCRGGSHFPGYFFLPCLLSCRLESRSSCLACCPLPTGVCCVRFEHG